MSSTHAINTIHALAEAIRTAETIPNGHLYAFVCGTLTMGDYTAAISVLKGAGLVSESNNLLRWTGPRYDHEGGQT